MKRICLLLIGVVLLHFALLAFPASSTALPHLQATEDSMAAPKREPVFFKSGKYTLHGQLVSPEKPSKKLPAIIFLVGSGEIAIESPAYAPMLDSLFEKNLPLDSVALFYFDKRGIGKSEGKWYKATFEERAEDAKAAADYLKTLPFIDGDRIAVVGHSQGGWITQICLAKYPETFMGGISLAGPTFDVRQQLINDYTSAYMCNLKLPEEEAKKKAIQQTNRAFTAVSVLPINDQWKQLRVIKKFEPTHYLSTIQKPLLLMFAENDALVSPSKCITELHKIYPGGIPANIQTVTIGGANHGFKLADLCYQGRWSERPFAGDSKFWIRDWTRTHLLH